MIDPILEQKMDVIAEEIFGSEKDPSQIPITKASGKKLNSLTPHWCQYELDEHQNPISWVVVVPTTQMLADRFLNGDITERQLFDLTKPQKAYSALYIASVITIAEHRGKGLATKLLHQAIDGISKTDGCILFAWPYSSDGARMFQRWNATEKQKIILKS